MIEIGTQVGKYRLDKKLGKGKNSAVFHAIDPGSNRVVAVKAFATNDTTSQNHLLHEAQLLKRLTHPNIVQILDWGRANNAVYLVTEYVDGVTINEIIPKDRGLPLQEVWPLMEQIAQGVEAAHQLGIVHLDLKPSNILVQLQESGDNIIRIIDFGIAEDINSSSGDTSPKPMGTPGYVAPEQVMRHLTPDIRADVYSLGALLAFFLTGQRPFSGDSPEQILAKQMAGPPTVLHQSYLGQSEELQKIVAKATQKDPYDRYLNVAELMEAISVYHRSILFKNDSAVPEGDPSEDLTATRLGHLVIGSVIVFILCFIAVLYYWLFTTF